MAIKEAKERNQTVIDLFAGCGGLSLGLYQAGWEGLFDIEKNPFAFETLKYNLIDNKVHFQRSDRYEIKMKYSTGGKIRKLEVPRYTQIGNAIPPLFAELAGKIMFNYLECNRKYNKTTHWNLDAGVFGWIERVYERQFILCAI